MDINDAYRAFWRLLDEKKENLGVTLDFDGICTLTGIAPDLLDPYLYEELGYTGDQIIAAYGLMSCN